MDELADGNDELAVWAKSEGEEFYKETDAATLPKLLKWLSGCKLMVMNRRYQTFLQIADYYLISYALAHGHTVVTHEVQRILPVKLKYPMFV